MARNKGTGVFPATRPFKDQSNAWHTGTLHGLNDLEALITVVCMANEWTAAHALGH
jgi:hypothetical protein